MKFICDWEDKTKDFVKFLSWTSTVAAATWVVTYFIVDSQKIESYQSKAEAAEKLAQTYQAKISVLESDVLKLSQKNDLYLRWLEENPKGFLSLETKIIKIEEELSQCKMEKKNLPVRCRESQEVSNIFNIRKGQAYRDSMTGLVLGVTDIDSYGKLTGTLTFPNKSTTEIKGVEPGKVWNFTQGNENYKLIIKESNWINNSVEAEIISGPQK